MDHLRKYTFIVFLLAASLACSLLAAPASPVATIPVSPTVLPTDTQIPAATIEPSETPAPADTVVPTGTPDSGLSSLPLPFTNLMGVAQYFNPVGQPVQTWNGVPIMPQATAGQEFKPGAVYSFKAAATIAQSVRFYESKMPALGFSLNGEPGSGSSGTGSNTMHNSFLYCYKGSQILLIYIASYDSNPNQTIVVLSTQ